MGARWGELSTYLFYCSSYFIEVESLLILSFYLYGYVVVKFMRKNKLLNLSKADLTKIKV